MQIQLIANPVDVNAEKICETESASTGVLQDGLKYINAFLRKT